jgi:hypothetical protein
MKSVPGRVLTRFAPAVEANDGQGLAMLFTADGTYEDGFFRSSYREARDRRDAATLPTIRAATISGNLPIP